MNTFWPRISASFGAISRMVTSVPPPVAKGTTMRTARLGQVSCARSTEGMASPPRESAARLRRPIRGPWRKDVFCMTLISGLRWNCRLRARSEGAAIHRQHLTRDEGGEVGGEEQHRIRDLLRLPHAAQRDALDDARLPLGPVTLPLAMHIGAGEEQA